MTNRNNKTAAQNHDPKKSDADPGDFRVVATRSFRPAYNTSAGKSLSVARLLGKLHSFGAKRIVCEAEPLGLMHRFRHEHGGCKEV